MNMSTVMLIFHIWAINHTIDSQKEGEKCKCFDEMQWIKDADEDLRVCTSQAINKHVKESSWNKRIMIAVSAIHIDYFDGTN